ncbi:MAG TPA: roadblock/LC7 domain-containing protein [Gemmatimonadales bacterium]|nr:roadblock/LC7 domain-containing protein [Gemmatimonadales bacterium]
MKMDIVASLEAITRVRGVRGAMIVSSEEGLVVAESSMEGIDGAAVAALTAGVLARLTRATEAAGRTAPAFVHLRAEGGGLMAVPAQGDLLVVAVTDPEVNVGLVRLEMRRAAEHVA